MSSDEDSVDVQREKFRNERVVDDGNKCSGTVSECDADSCFGPALPPHLISRNQRDEGSNIQSKPCESNNGDVCESGDVYGPQIPGKSIIGPDIPHHLLARDSTEDEKADTEEEEDEVGPSITLMRNVDTEVNSIPNCFYKSKQNTETETVKKRESWMTELPSDRAAHFGLGSRQFRTRLPHESECDRSGWTETPMDKEKDKSRLQISKNDEKIIKQKQIDEKNREMERLIKKIEKKKKKKKKESLLELHQKKLKKKAKKEAKKREKEGKPVERRPFDRNIDLQVNRFDEGQKRAVLKKAALLNDRFASGESKFL